MDQKVSDMKAWQAVILICVSLWVASAGVIAFKKAFPQIAA